MSERRKGHWFGGRVVFRPGFPLRLALVMDLWVWLLWLVLFVLLPVYGTDDGRPNTITGTEWVLATLVVVPAFGLVGRMLEKPRFPYNEWAYLVTAGYGGLILFVFLLVTAGVVADEIVVTAPSIPLIVVGILIGWVGAAPAHILDGGGRRTLGPTIERWMRANGHEG